MKMIIGIDPGMNGGISMLEELHSSGDKMIFSCSNIMPIAEIKKNKKMSREIDLSEVYELFLTWKEISVLRHEVVVKVFIEQVNAMPGQGVVSMFGFGKGYGELIGMAYAFFKDITPVPPQRWKRFLFGGGKHTKQTSIDFVSNYYPSVNLTPGRKRTPHDGIADSICIAHYGLCQ